MKTESIEYGYQLKNQYGVVLQTASLTDKEAIEKNTQLIVDGDTEEWVKMEQS